VRRLVPAQQRQIEKERRGRAVDRDHIEVAPLTLGGGQRVEAERLDRTRFDRLERAVPRPSVPGLQAQGLRSSSVRPAATSSWSRAVARAASARSSAHRALSPVSGVLKPTRRNVRSPLRTVSPSTTWICGLSRTLSGASRLRPSIPLGFMA
jgi:hypothetical protein